MIKKQLIKALFIFCLFFSLKINAQVSIIPKPNDIKFSEGKFNYANGVDIKIIRGDDATKLIQKQLIDAVKNKNIAIKPFFTTAISINLLQPKTTAIPADGYSLIIQPTSIMISSSGNTGLFYGVQSLLQLLNADSTKNLSCIEINDAPAFAFRSMHLDVAHQFFNVDVIKQYIDVMAKLKLNQFHWQIANESTWRIELKSATLLTDKENFYTIADVKDIVKYAQEHYVTIIPEINLISTQDSLLQKSIVDEVCALFPGSYIQLGKGFVTNELARYISSKNKTIIGIDKLLYAKGVLLSVKSNKNGWKEAAKGNDVIMAPRQYCALDYYQDWDDEKKSFGMTLLPLEKAYFFNPIGKIKDKNTLQHILGGQANVSTEFIKNTDELKYQIFPRLLAIAEAVWTNNNQKNYADFQKRLKAQKNYFFIDKEQPKIDMVRFKPQK